MRVAEAMESTAAALAAAGCLSDRAEAELALRRLTAAQAGDVDHELADAEVAALKHYVDRRRAGDPPHYILGGCEFMERWIQLDRTAYIPRPWTEVMVGRAIDTLDGPGQVVDLGTGSGALALVMAESLPACHVWALDVDARAIEWARVNTASLANVTVLVSDLFGSLPHTLTGRVDLVIGSLPYVPTGELAALPRDYRDHEPALALDGGGDGLGLDTRALRDARTWLQPGGRVMLELGHRQGRPLASEARRLGYRVVTVHVDEEGDDLFLECSR